MATMGSRFDAALWGAMVLPVQSCSIKCGGMVSAPTETLCTRLRTSASRQTAAGRPCKSTLPPRQPLVRGMRG